MVKALVIGIGLMGSRHLNALLRLKSRGIVSEVYAVDIDASRLERVTGVDYKGTSLEEALRLKPDIAIIATPTPTHTDIASRLLDKCSVVLIEKPLSCSLKDAVEFLKKARKSSTTIVVGHIERFNPVVKLLLKRLKGVEINAIYSTRTNPMPKNPSLYCNVLLDLGIHDLDLALYITSSSRVFVESRVLKGEPATIGYASLRLDEIPYALYASWGHGMKRRVFQVMSDKGVLTAFLDLKVAVLEDGSYVKAEGNSLLEEELHVINVFRGLERPIVEPFDAVAPIAIIECILDPNCRYVDLELLKEKTV